MVTTFNEKEYTKRVRNAFIKALNSDALKYSTFKKGEHKRRATQRAHNYVPGACLCENIVALACVATINGYRDIEENGRKKRVGILKVGKNELLIDFVSLMECQHPYTGVCGENAYKSVNSDIYIKSEIIDSSKNLLQLFEDDEMVGKKCVLRYSVPTVNERGEKTCVIVLDALWTEEFEEKADEEENMDYPMYHDPSLDEPLYEDDEDEEEEEEDDTFEGSDDDDIPEDFDEDDAFEDDEEDNFDHTIADDDSDGMGIRYALMKSQIFAFEYILKYPMAAASIPCDVYTMDGVFIGQEYGQRQAEIVADVFKEYRRYFENRLKELKQRQCNNCLLISPSANVLDF